jgi:hypothetical protein
MLQLVISQMENPYRDIHDEFHPANPENLSYKFFANIPTHGRESVLELVFSPQILYN